MVILIVSRMQYNFSSVEDIATLPKDEQIEIVQKKKVIIETMSGSTVRTWWLPPKQNARASMFQSTA